MLREAVYDQLYLRPCGGPDEGSGSFHRYWRAHALLLRLRQRLFEGAILQNLDIRAVPERTRPRLDEVPARGREQ